MQTNVIECEKLQSVISIIRIQTKLAIKTKPIILSSQRIRGAISHQLTAKKGFFLLFYCFILRNPLYKKNIFPKKNDAKQKIIINP